ncbi:MAG TPA: hypothetical protein VG964_00440 [Candidatus Saccharimonadales bacterium]|nr:hypothetical protein [Candidatus Saccharimonadales bacterium]
MAENHETERRPEIKWLGPVGGEKPNRKWWRGTISARMDILMERFGLNELGVQQKMAELKNRVGDFFVAADPNAQVRCIDGRDEDEDTREDGVGLGPQVSGGTPVSAFTLRLARRGDMPGDTVEDDFQVVSEIVAKAGLPYGPGAHEDSGSADTAEKTGCGAIDYMIEIAGIMGDREAMYDYVKAVLGEDFNEQAFDEIIEEVGKYTEPEQRDKYFMRGKHGKTLIKTAKNLGKKQGKKAVEKLRGTHNEVFLIINKVVGETFDRDGFSAENQHLAQAFNYDLWHVVERAHALFPDDEPARMRLITAQVMYAVGTAMALTDGSLELGIRA